MNIVVAGGTGFVGRHLCWWLATKGHRVTILSRDPLCVRNPREENMALAQWNGSDPRTVQDILTGAHTVINLSGESIAARRWTRARKQQLIDSRIESTRCLVEALARLSESAHSPVTLINASGVGLYGPRDRHPVDETTPAGQGFLADLCRRWEHEAIQAEAFGVRVVRLRIGLVLGRDGGALPQMALPFRLWLGGPLGPGHQPISWIHQDDLSRLIEWLLDNRHIHGPVNAVAPHPTSMRALCSTLGRVLHRPSWLPIPEFVLKLGLGELATVMTTGQWVEPRVALRHGFTFRYPDLEPALRSLFEHRS